MRHRGGRSKAVKVKVRSYIARYPVIRTVQSTTLADLFIGTPSRLLWEAFSHGAITA